MIAAKKQPLRAPASAVRRSIPLGGAACAAEEGEGAYTFGFDRADGTLRRGAGAAALSAEGVPANDPVSAAFFDQGCAALVGESGRLYLRGEEEYEEGGLTFARTPCALAVPDGGMLLWDGTVSAFLTESGAEQTAFGAFAAAAYSYDRLWLGEGSRLRFSAPASSDLAGGRGQGGYIDVPDGAGKIAALCPLRGGLYLFRERGIERLDARGDEEEFSLHGACACPQVYGETVAAAGEGIFFLTARGPYRFDGNKAAPFAADFAPFFAGVRQEGARACAAGGRYFLQARARIGGKDEDVLAVFRTDGTGGYILRRAVRGIAACGDNVYFAYEGKPCRLAEGGAFVGRYGRAVWSRAVEAPASRGLLRSVCVRADGVFSLTVRSERGTRYLRVLPGEHVLPVSLPGERFILRLEGEDAGTVYSLSARFAQKGGPA